MIANNCFWQSVVPIDFREHKLSYVTSLVVYTTRYQMNHTGQVVDYYDKRIKISVSVCGNGQGIHQIDPNGVPGTFWWV